MSDIQQSLLQSMEIIATTKDAEIPYDYTIRGKIISITDGDCVVDINGEQYSAKIKDGIVISTGDVVLVQVLRNNFSDKIITGKVGLVGISSSHSHTNLTVLETITSEDIDKWNSGTGSGGYISSANATDLTDSGDTTLHYHSTDRSRANHTGTQLAITISDFLDSVRGTVLTGLSTATNAVITATDTVLSSIGKLQKQISDNLTTLTSHINNISNPHSVTKSQIGLGNVSNLDQTNPANITQNASYRFVTDAEKTAWNAKQAVFGYTPENVANKNLANGYAGLDVNGKIDSAQLPTITANNVDFHSLNAALTTLDADEFIIYDSVNSVYKKISKANLFSSISPETYVVYFGNEEFTATAGQTVFNLTSGSYTTGAHRMNVYIWGLKQPSTAFTETSATSITLVSAIEDTGTKVMLEWTQYMSVIDYIHASSHATGGTDPITPAMIGAETPANAQTKANIAESNAKAYADTKFTSYTHPTVVAGTGLGHVKSGTDITVDASGNVTVNDDSHSHVVSNVDGLQTALDNKLEAFHTLSAMLTSIDNDELIMFDSTSQVYKKITKQHLFAGVGGSGYVVLQYEEEFTAIEGQTVFTLTKGTYQTGNCRIEVFINGIRQPNTAYTETSEVSITLASGVSADDKVLIKYISAMDVMNYLHANNHAIGGIDAISPASIGASPIEHVHQISEIPNLQTSLDSKLSIDDARLKQSTYVTSTAITEGYYRVATIDMTSSFKNAMFKVKAYTATGTTTESTITVDMAYYASNYTSQYSGIIANTSHSYNSQTNAENGYVLLYCRVSFDASNGYIDLYKYKTTAVTMEIQPLIESDWVWSTGTLTVNPTVGSYRNTAVVLYAGLSGNQIVASSASSSTYSNYGVLGTHTLSNTVDKTGQWAYVGNWYFEYNSSYLKGRSGNVRIRLQELNVDGTKDLSALDDFIISFTVGLGTHIDSTTFNSLVPTCRIEIEGKTSLTENDIAALVYSTSTSTKYIRLYVKLKEAYTVYCINPEQRYGRSFTSSNSQTTSYSNFNYAGDQTPITALPTPAQGSVTYAVKRTVDISDIPNLQTVMDAKAPLISPNFSGTATANTPTTGTNNNQIATTAFVQASLGASGYGDMMKSVYDTNGDGIVNNSEKLDGFDSTDFTRKFNLTGQLQTTSYRKSVIALCDLTNTDTGANSYSHGQIFFKRNNGLYNALSIMVSAEKRYNSTSMNYYGLIMSTANSTAVRPCTFTYNGVKYGGVEVNISNAEANIINFIGASNFNVFGLDYYNTASATVLYADINSSISFSGDICQQEGLYFNNQKIWHEGNDGTGTGLDADKVKGIDYSVSTIAPTSPTTSDIWIDLN